MTLGALKLRGNQRTGVAVDSFDNLREHLLTGEGELIVELDDYSAKVKHEGKTTLIGLWYPKGCPHPQRDADYNPSHRLRNLLKELLGLPVYVHLSSQKIDSNNTEEALKHDRSPNWWASIEFPRAEMEVAA